MQFQTSRNQYEGVACTTNWRGGLTDDMTLCRKCLEKLCFKLAVGNRFKLQCRKALRLDCRQIPTALALTEVLPLPMQLQIRMAADMPCKVTIGRIAASTSFPTGSAGIIPAVLA